MHECDGSKVHLPVDGTFELRCSNCARIVAIRNGGDVLMRRHRDAMVMVSAGSLVIKCFACGEFNISDGDDMRRYDS